MTAKKQSRSGVEGTLKAASDAAKTKLPTGATFAVDGTVYTAEALQSKLDSYLSLYTDARSKRTELRAAVQSRDAVQPEVVKFLDSLQGVLGGFFGSDNAAALEPFGFSPRKKPAPLTAEQLLVRETKAKATRAKRQTLGKRQKAALKATGTPIISAVMPADVPSPEPPAPVAGPASPAASAPLSGGDAPAAARGSAPGGAPRS